MTQKTLGIQNIIKFYRANRKHGFLSNLYKAEIEFEGKIFLTSEHAYQYGKFRNLKKADWLMSCPYPDFVAILSHNLFGYDIVSDWKLIKVKRMEAVVRAKFNQHSDLKQLLLDTGNAILIEESKFDNFWGEGKYGKGKNMLGKILMKIREELKD